MVKYTQTADELLNHEKVNYEMVKNTKTWITWERNNFSTTQKNC